jgi:L-lactate dehydrogenase (cytochrome)
VKPANIADYREAARRRLPRVLFDYIDGGAYAERTMAANVSDLEAIELRQRVLVDVGKLSMGTELFGRKLSMPVALSPVGLAGMYHRRGEAQAAAAAQKAGVPFSLSTVGVCSISEVAKAAGAPPWFQLYMIRDRGFMKQVLAAAREAACPVLLFTVDLPMPGARYRDTRNAMTAQTFEARARRVWQGMTHPGWAWDVMARGGPHSFANVAAANPDMRGIDAFWPWIVRNFDPTVTWDDIAWVREQWPGPLVLKGVLDVEDAREAVRRGVEGIVVSNHGGRQLDGVASGIAALPAIADAVGDQLTVLMDGGVRSGLDVLKALAYGADGVLIGRAWAWALAAGGEAGVTHMLNIMRQELRMAMALTGCTDVRQAGRNLIAR